MRVRRQQFYADLTLTVLCRFNPDVFMQVWPCFFNARLTPTFHVCLTLTVSCRFDPDGFFSLTLTFNATLTTTVSCRFDPDCPPDKAEAALKQMGTNWGVTKQTFVSFGQYLKKHSFISGSSLGSTVNSCFVRDYLAPVHASEAWIMSRILRNNEI